MLICKILFKCIVFFTKGIRGIKYKMKKIREIMLRYEIEKKTVIKVILIVILLIGSLAIRSSANPNKHIEKEVSKSNSEMDEKVEENVVIDISGEVKYPGIYKMKGRVRLYEVIEKAGGLKEEANINSINQARYVNDGEKILIPSMKNLDNKESITDNSSSDNLININFATKEELMKLPGVGDVTANMIIEYREKSSFTKKEDIKNVNGIGEATYKKIESMISI